VGEGLSIWKELQAVEVKCFPPDKRAEESQGSPELNHFTF